MAPFRDFNNPPQRLQRYVKKGRIHSEKARKRRAEEWMEKWSSIIGLSNRVVENLKVDDETMEMLTDEQGYSNAIESLKGFEFQGVHDCVTIYGMTREQIENLEMEANLTTDEDDDDEERFFSPVALSLQYSALEKKLNLCPLNSDRNSVNVNTCTLSSPSFENINGGIDSSTLSFPNDLKFDHKSLCLQPDGSAETSPSIMSSYNSINGKNAPLQLSFNDNLSTGEGNTNKDDEDDEDLETERTRPVSRISLVLPYNNKNNNNNDDDDDDGNVSDCEIRSGYLSFYQSDNEDDSDPYQKILKSGKQSKGVYGKIAGVNVGTVWKNRRQFSRRSVHRPQNASVHGGPKGAYSMVLSLTYSVNDRGEEFDYFGEGGRDQKTKKHVRDQKMERGNLSLRDNIQTGTAVRVVRGFQLQNKYAPEQGYRYDGLYEVTQCTMDRKIDGYKVFMFTFVRCGCQPPPPWHIPVCNMPLPLPSSYDDLSIDCSSSEDDAVSDIQRHKKPNRKKRKRTTLPEISRNSTPLSLASDDIPPQLQLHDENYVECPIVYPFPPRLSPSLALNSAVTDIQSQPVIWIQKFDKDIVADAAVKSVNLKSEQMVDFIKRDVKKIKALKRIRMKNKRKHTQRNKNLSVNANILKKKEKKIPNITKNMNNTKKSSAKKMKHLQNTNKRTVEKQTVKKKQSHSKNTFVSEVGASDKNVAIKKRGRPLKMETLNNTNLHKSLGKGGAKKDILIKKPINKTVKRPQIANAIKSKKPKKPGVTVTQNKKLTASNVSNKKTKKNLSIEK